MTKVGESIVRGLQEAVDYAQGKDVDVVVHQVARIPETVDVKVIRGRLGMSQARFSAAYGFSIDAIRNWEQGRRTPDPSARALLTVIEKEPETVQRALSA